MDGFLDLQKAIDQELKENGLVVLEEGAPDGPSRFLASHAIRYAAWRARDLSGGHVRVIRLWRAGGRFSGSVRILSFLTNLHEDP